MKKAKLSLLATLLFVAQATWADETVTTADELLLAVQTSQTVKLGSDITTPSDGGRLDIKNGTTVTLDLNGHTLKRLMTAADPGGQVIFVAQGGKLTITDSGSGGHITGGWALEGGGIYVQAGGELTITGGTISGNTAEKDANGDFGEGGGIDNFGTLTISGGTISGNTAKDGGGIFNHTSGTLTMTGGTISSNKAEDGGGICNEGTGQITGVTVSGNTASDNGGGIYAWATASGSMVLTDVTITNNQAQAGGGVSLSKPELQNCTVELRGACTITGNTATLFGGGIYHFGYLDDAREGPTLKMQDKPVVQSNAPTDVHIGNYQLITLSAAFSTGARVGVYCANEQQTEFTSGYKNHNGDTDPDTYFFVSSPTADGDVVWSGDEAAIQATGYKYVERGWDAANNKLTETTKVCENYTVINSSISDDKGWIGLEDGQWYVATGTAEVSALNVLGTAHLILRDGAKLTVVDGVKVEQGYTLHIYGQPKGIGVPGKLIATNDKYYGAAIGGGTEKGTSGDIIIHGGDIEATGTTDAAAIGGANDGNVGNIIIYGGTIVAMGGRNASAIGSGDTCDKTTSGNITIYGGNIYAEGGLDAAGIGNGNKSPGATIKIFGGDITAVGGENAAGIGSGFLTTTSGYGWGDIYIHGGKVEAHGGRKSKTGSGIGGGHNGFKGNITITGGEVHAYGYNTCKAIGVGHNGKGNAWEYAQEGTITISGGTVYATCVTGDGIGGENGMRVNITGGEIYARTAGPAVNVKESSHLTLADNLTVYSSTDADQLQRQDANGRVAALLDDPWWKDSNTEVKPCNHEGKTVNRFDDDYHYFSCSYCLTTPADNKAAHAYNDGGICETCGKGLAVKLSDNADNSSTLATYNGKPVATVTLDGRTLYKDGSWNTLCLPFDVEIESSTLQGATAKYLSNATLSKGTLTLDFKDVPSYVSDGSNHTVLQAGTPYLLKWTTTGDPIQQPQFSSCLFVGTEPTDVTIGNVLTFRGIYDPLSLVADDNTKLYLGDDNKLYYPTKAMTIGAFRAYFQLAEGITAGSEGTLARIVLNLGDDTTGINNGQWSTDNGQSEAWFTLDGRRTTGKPSAKGIYIYNGRKYIVK